MQADNENNGQVQRDAQNQRSLLKQSKCSPKSRLNLSLTRTPNIEDHNYKQFTSSAKHSQVFSKKQNEFLQYFFKCSCFTNFNHSKPQTFDYLKVLSQSISLIEWMMLCRNLDVIRFFGQSRDITRTLNSIFKRFANKQKRLDFERFCDAFDLLIQAMVKFTSSKDEYSGVQMVKKYLGIDSQANYLLKIQKMGGNLPLVTRSHPPSSKRRQYTKSLDNLPKLKQKPVFTQHVYHTKHESSYQNNITLSTREPVKIYRKREDRVRSRILKNLETSSLSRLIPNQELKQNFDAYLQEDDKFLKEYMDKKREIKNGIMDRLHKIQSKYQNIKPNLNIKKTSMRHDKNTQKIL